MKPNDIVKNVGLVLFHLFSKIFNLLIQHNNKFTFVCNVRISP